MDYRSLEHKIRDVMIAEMESRNTAIRRKVENVGRPKDNVKDETSKLGKQGEIQRKIVDEDFKDENGDVKPKKVKDVDTDNDKQKISKTDPQNVDDPKEIKGGKTQVDLHPKTNDAPEDQEREDKVSKKAANAANKEIGAKGVKEETMTGKLTLGSSQSQINAVVEAMKMMKGMCSKCGKSPCQCDGDPKKMKEELVSGQKKLDANHNGKIDAQDFKLLKAKKMKEEVEELDERDMGNKAKKDAAVAGVGAKNRDEKHLGSRGMKTDVADKIRGREKMSGKDRMEEEVEQVNEILDTPMKKLGYIAKNAYQVATADPAKMANDPKKANAIANRVIGAKRLQKKLNKEEVQFSEAEIARIEEIAKSL